MNNSYFAIESNVLQDSEQAVDVQAILKEREGQLLRIIEAIQEVKKTKGWRTLTAELFTGLAEDLRKKLFSESSQEHPDTLKLNRLTGQLLWAEKYADLDKLEGAYRAELANIRLKYGKI